MRRALAILTLLFVTLATPAIVLAQAGRPQLDLRVDPAQPTAGQPATISFAVAATGGPSNLALLKAYPITIRNIATGQLVETAAEMTGGDRYSATVVFPAAGSWRVTVTAFPTDSLVVTVGPGTPGATSATAASGGAPSSSMVSPISPTALPRTGEPVPIAALAVVGVVVLAAGIMLRRGRRPGPPPA
jgi:hypothetical protein